MLRYAIPIPLAATAIAMILPITASSASSAMSGPIVRTAIVLLTAFLSLSYLLRIMYRTSAKAMLIIVLWGVLTWIVPLFIDFFRFAAFGFDEKYLFSRIFACSPIGALYFLCSNEQNISTNIGLGVQVVLTTILAVLFYAGQKPKQHDNPPVTPVSV